MDAQQHGRHIEVSWGARAAEEDEFAVAVIRPGRVLFEMGGISEEEAREALRLASYKLPCKTRIIKRIDPISGQELN